MPWYIQAQPACIDKFAAHLRFTGWAQDSTRGLDSKEQSAWVQTIWELCRMNPAFLGHYYGRIQFGQGGSGAFDNWTPGQRKVYLAALRQWAGGDPSRLIILKARRQGVSTVTQLLNFWRCCFFPGATGLISAHEDDAATTLYGMFEFFFDNLPDELKPAVRSRNMSGIHFDQPDAALRKKHPGLNSRISHRTVAPGGGTKANAGKGRSKAIHFHHASEAGFWDSPATYWTGVAQCVEDYQGTFVVMESTANGFGWFSEMWDEAARGWDLVYDRERRINRWKCQDPKASRSDMRPVFLSWLEEPKYRKPFDCEDDMAAFCRDLDHEEQSLVKVYGAHPDQLNWRRRMLYGNKFNGNLNKFHQEYPTTPQEAFVSSGRKVFDVGALRWAENRTKTSDIVGTRCDFTIMKGVVERLTDPEGPVVIYREPIPEVEYVIGIDGCWGKPKGDFACAQVLRKDTWEQVAVIHGRLDADQMADPAAALGTYYNEALAVVETTGGIGVAIQKAMDDLGYHHFYQRTAYEAVSKAPKKEFGYPMTGKSRTHVVQMLKRALRDMPRGEGLILHDRPTIIELMGWILKRSPSGKVKEAPHSDATGYDDRIMSLGIALAGIMDDGEGGVIVSKPSGNAEGFEPDPSSWHANVQSSFWEPKRGTQIPHHWNV